MVKKKKIPVIVSLGDVFAIPIGNSKFGYGQVVGEGNPKTYVIYDVLADSHPELTKIITMEILFFAHTVDVLIEDGEWLLLGNQEVPSKIKFPDYVVDTPKGYYVTDFKGDLLRPANDSEVEKLQTRKSISPSIVEDAVKARYGFEEWYPYLDKLKYNN
jgi:hypothetical protein